MREYTFKKELFGYSKKDVTAYIDKLITEYDQLNHTRSLDAEAIRKEMTALKAENERLSSENEKMQTEKTAVANAMVEAQKNAAHLVDEAKAEIDALRKNFEEELHLMELKKTEAEEKLASFQKEIKARIRNLEPHVEHLTENE